MSSKILIKNRDFNSLFSYKLCFKIRAKVFKFDAKSNNKNDIFNPNQTLKISSCFNIWHKASQNGKYLIQRLKQNHLNKNVATGFLQSKALSLNLKNNTALATKICLKSSKIARLAKAYKAENLSAAINLCLYKMANAFKVFYANICLKALKTMGKNIAIKTKVLDLVKLRQIKSVIKPFKTVIKESFCAAFCIIFKAILADKDHAILAYIRAQNSDKSALSANRHKI